MSKGNMFDPGHPDGEFGLQTELVQSNGSYCYGSALYIVITLGSGAIFVSPNKKKYDTVDNI